MSMAKTHTSNISLKWMTWATSNYSTTKQNASTGSVHRIL